ncbi:hypothetical protein BHE74_00046677, partial [Ensete ventricosum]
LRANSAARSRTESDCGGGCSTAERHHTALEEEEDRRFDMARMEELQSALVARGLAVASIPGKGRGLITTRDFAPGESPFLPRPSLGTTRFIFGQQLLDEKSLPCSTSIGFLILLSSVGFSLGDVIIFQEPYASTPNKTSSGSTCDGCFASNNLKKCSACQVAWYCGTACQVRLHVYRADISEIDEKQLVLYAQMANLVSLVLPSLEIDLKETTHNFSKVNSKNYSIFAEYIPLLILCLVCNITLAGNLNGQQANLPFLPHNGLHSYDGSLHIRNLLLEFTEDALKSFIKAADVLRITHGTRTPFMKELLHKLEEARAEVSYKLSASD